MLDDSNTPKNADPACKIRDEILIPSLDHPGDRVLGRLWGRGYIGRSEVITALPGGRVIARCQEYCEKIGGQG